MGEDFLNPPLLDKIATGGDEVTPKTFLISTMASITSVQVAAPCDESVLKIKSINARTWRT